MCNHNLLSAQLFLLISIKVGAMCRLVTCCSPQAALSPSGHGMAGDRGCQGQKTHLEIHGILL